MNNVKILDNNQDFKKIENIRCKALNVENISNDNDNYYLNELINKNSVAFAYYINDEIAAGCYISDARNYLYVDYLFTNPKYKGNNYGQKLLQYILENKYIVEDFFNKKFDYSYLEPSCEKVKKIYRVIGYRETNNIFDEMKIKI